MSDRFFGPITIADIRGGAIIDSRYATDINYTGELGRGHFWKGQWNVAYNCCSVMFSCLQLLISWTNLPWLLEKGEKSAGWSADWSGGREVSWCRVGEGLHWNVSWAKVSGWAQHAPLDKINQCTSACFCHCHTFFSYRHNISPIRWNPQ